MLEHFYKERRSIVDFRRGPLGPHFDGFADYLTRKKYSHDFGRSILGKSCQFNAFLIERGVAQAKDILESLIEPFLEAYDAPVRALSARYSPRNEARLSLKHLFAYLLGAKILKPACPKRVVKPYSWLVEPYYRYLREEQELSEHTIKYRYQFVVTFLDSFGRNAERRRFKRLKAETVDRFIKEHFKNSTAYPVSLAGTLRQFFRYCAERGLTRIDFTGLVPTIRRYRYASLPKGMEDSALERLLAMIQRETPFGARDYAMVMIMMAYGLRAVSVAELLLEDLDWHHSRIRIRAQKGGKEVVVPLLEPVGEALIQYLRHRPSDTPYREVFLGLKAPYVPLSGLAIAAVVQKHMKKAGVKTPDSGVRTLRHSWAIRALAHNSAIKAIADVLGHRYIDTTFIYAKADLNSLREVAMPWPKKD